MTALDVSKALQARGLDVSHIVAIHWEKPVRDEVERWLLGEQIETPEVLYAFDYDNKLPAVSPKRKTLF